VDAGPFLLHEIPLHALKSELDRRLDAGAPNEQDGSTCGSNRVGSYNTPVHVFALFLILILSTLGEQH
jgi:hypothetical protein